MTTADKIIDFNSKLKLDITLPKDIRVMNPFGENTDATKASTEFFKKYMDDNRKRRMILAINPGRFGAGHTGITLTDTKNLKAYCDIDFPGDSSYEISSVFFYHMIEAYGGVQKFYGDFYVNAVCPLGFEFHNEKMHWVNYNYYENPNLKKSVTPFIKKSLETELTFDIDNSVCFCLGTSDNYDFLSMLNKEQSYFKKIVPLPHPRYIQEYKSKDDQLYIDQYLEAFSSN